MTAEQIQELADTMSLKDFSNLAACVMEKHFGPAQYGAVTWATADRGPQAVLPVAPLTPPTGDAPKRGHAPGSLSPSESSRSPTEVARVSR